MKYIDFHCDTLCAAFLQQKKELALTQDTMISPDKLRVGECAAQFFAIYMMPESDKVVSGVPIPDDDSYIDSLHSILNESIKNDSSLAFCRNYGELQENSKNGKISAFLTLEDGRAVRGSMEKLEKFHDMGVRLISLTWNFINCFGYPNSLDPEIMNKGLTSFGKDAVRRMNELGMFVDVSHLSDAGFYDVADISTKPFIASHSNCRSIAPHQRNLTDEMIRILADKGGVAGLNFCPAFIHENIENTHSTAQLIAKQARYMANCGGIELVGIGSDFDGIRGVLEVDGPDKMYLLWDALKKEGFTESEIEKIAFKNAERIIKDVL